MLVVDGVELVLVDQPLEMRELERDHALGLQQTRDAGDEVVEVGNLRQHVVADDEIGLACLRPHSCSRARCRRTRPASECPCRRAASATLAAGSMPSTGTPSGRKCCSR